MGSPAQSSPHQPLADRLRPQALSDIVGQEHLTGEGGALSRLSVVAADAVAETVREVLCVQEIHEQVRSVTDAMRGRLSHEEATAKLGGLNMSNAELRAVERIVLTGCGTALHAAMVGEYLIETLAQIPTECEFASEFRYRNLPMAKDTLVFVMSQSGETADTLAALRESQRKGHRTLGICNNVASTIARESDGGVYMHAGPEIGVAATMSFTSQVTVLTLIALLLGLLALWLLRQVPFAGAVLGFLALIVGIGALAWRTWNRRDSLPA